LSPAILWYLSSPSISTALSGTTTIGAYAAPLARWQSRQWQFTIRIGSAFTT